MFNRIRTTLTSATLFVALLLLTSFVVAARYNSDHDTSPTQVDDVELPFEGSIGGQANALAIANGTIYLGDGAGLLILNANTLAPISRLSLQSPTTTSQKAGVVNDIAIVDTTVYILSQTENKNYVSVVKANNPDDPTLVDTHLFYSPSNIQAPCNRIDVQNTYAYVVCGEDTDSGMLRIIDVQNPAEMKNKGTLNTSGTAQDIVVQGNYAYIADGSNGAVVIANISNPDSPSTVRTIDLTQKNASAKAVDMYLTNNNLYVADDDAGFHRIDVQDPANPGTHDFFDIEIPTTRVYAANGVVYTLGINIFLGSSSLYVIDPNSPAEPLGSIDTPASNFAFDSTTAYLAGNGTLTAVDVGTPSNPTATATYSALGNVYDVQIVGSIAYVTNNAASTFSAIDVSNTNAPRLLGQVALPGMARGIHIAGTQAYVAIGSKGLQIINISNPSAPQLQGTVDTTDSAYDVVVNGTYAYVANDDDGIAVIDVSNPDAPAVEQNIDTAGEARGVFLHGNRLYVADREEGVHAYDVSNPAQPGKTTTYFKDTGGAGLAQNVFATDSHVYVAYGNAGLVLFDTTGAELANHKLPCSTCEPCNTLHVVAVEQSDATMAYVTCSDKGVYAVDMTNPSSLVSRDSFDTPGEALALEVIAQSDETHTIYVADAEGGLQVLRADITPTPTPTPIPTDTPIPDDTATPTPTSPPEPQADQFEPDNSCATAQNIGTGGNNQSHTLHTKDDVDWVQFEAEAGVQYRIEARPHPDSDANVDIKAYPECESDPTGDPSTFGSAGMYVEGLTNGPFYIALQRTDNSVFTDNMGYDVSVQRIEPEPTPQPEKKGAVVIVAGRVKENDPLQPNIYHVTERVHSFFQNKLKYSSDRIFYLTTDEANPSSDGMPTKDTLKSALLEAKNHIGKGGPLTIYMMDHGNHDVFYLDEPRGHRLTPMELDDMLRETGIDAIEGLDVYIIIEACYSGSFIDRLQETQAPWQSVSKPGRVVITSTSADKNANAFEEGALFSDYFLTGLETGQSLFNSFEAALEVVNTFVEQHPDKPQEPWLDDNGNGAYNTQDGKVAATKWLFKPTYSDDDLFQPAYPPQIFEARPPDTITQGSGIIKAKTLAQAEDSSLERVWAIIYPPSYEPPEPSNEMAHITGVPSVEFTPDPNSDQENWYEATYTDFTEVGVYYIVVQAKDSDGYYAMPKRIAVPISSPDLAFDKSDTQIGQATHLQLTITREITYDHSIAWDFGDGTPLQTTRYTTTQHYYTQPGDYSVTAMIVPDSVYGMPSTIGAAQVAAVSPPTVNVYMDQSAPFCQPTTFSTTTNLSPDVPATMQIDFGDGSTPEEKDVSDAPIESTYIYTRGGVFTVQATLNAEPDGGTLSEGTDTIVVAEPSAWLDSTAGLVNQPTTFTVTVDMQQDAGVIKELRVDFGDGEEYKEEITPGQGEYTLPHTYTATGTYTAMAHLIPVDNACTTVASGPVAVQVEEDTTPPPKTTWHVYLPMIER